MTKDLRQKFETIFTKLIDTNCDEVEFMHNPKVDIQQSMVEGIDLKHAFHFVIKFCNNKDNYYLAFHYVDNDDLVSLSECKWWVKVITEHLGVNISICLVSKIGYTAEGFKYVCDRYFDKRRLILAKFCGDEEQSLVLNRLWTNYADKRGRTGVLTSSEHCTGAVLWMNYESYNVIGILSQLGIPIQIEYEFKCPYISDDKIEEKAIEVLKNYIDINDFYGEQDFLYRIAECEDLEIKLIEMGEECLGEYSCAEKNIYLNICNHLQTLNFRGRFTLAHELGHHFLHRYILEQYNLKAIDDNESINVVGFSNDHLRYFEYQANKFASLLLMPEKIFSEYAQKVMNEMDIHKGYVYDDYQYSPNEGFFNHITAEDFVNRVAKHFKVSYEAARYRLRGLNLLRENNQPKNMRDQMRTKTYI